MKKRILIVDDEPNMLVTLTDIINNVGYETVTVENGSRAVETAREQAFDVILMDFKMEGLNGVETFREIRKIHPDVKVIFITAYYHEGSVKDAIVEGAVGVCQKPLDIPQLLDYIKAAVGNT